MGLFGLFASLAGLGAMAKDAIGRSLEDSTRYEKAKANGEQIYTAGGHMKSVKTGERCHISYASDGHVYMTDLRTGKLIDDLTVIKNDKKQNDEIQKAKEKGWAFYRCTKWDLNLKECNIWVSDIYPGYYEKEYTSDDYMCIMRKGNLERNSFGKHEMCVNTLGIDEKYYIDGTKYSKEESRKRNNNRSKEEAIKKGKRFYELYGESLYYGDTQSDDIYKINFVKSGRSLYPYLTKAVRKYKEVPIPHHEGTKIVMYHEEVPNSERWNMDGTRYID